jgi:hypothetical protein
MSAERRTPAVGLFESINAMNQQYRDSLSTDTFGFGKLTEECEKMHDDVMTSQIGGDHYKKLGDFQPWMVASKWLTPEELKGAMKLTVLSYLCRESDKGGREDIKKALHTIELYLKVSEV